MCCRNFPVWQSCATVAENASGMEEEIIGVNENGSSGFGFKKQPKMTAKNPHTTVFCLLRLTREQLQSLFS